MYIDERETGLRVRLEAAYRRVDDATPGSPEWDAAKAGTDALEAQLVALRPRPASAARRPVAPIGPMVLEDGSTVQGSITASGRAAEGIRFDIAAIPGRARTRHEFVSQLQALARAAGLVVETQVDRFGLSFYVWDPADEPGTAG